MTYIDSSGKHRLLHQLIQMICSFGSMQSCPHPIPVPEHYIYAYWISENDLINQRHCLLCFKPYHAKLHLSPVIRSFLMGSRLHNEAPQITCHHQAKKPSTILNNPTSPRASPFPLHILISGCGPKQGRFTVRFPASSLRTR